MLQDKKEYSNILSDQNFDLSGQIDKFISVTQNALSTLTLNQFSEGFYEILNLYEPITQSISSNFGKTRDYSAQIKENIAGAAYQAQILGIQTNSLANAQLGVIEGMKIPIQLTRDEMLNFAATAKLFGKEGTAVAQMFSNIVPSMLKAGLQFGDITGDLKKIVETAQDYNVSVGSVYDLVAQNISKINTFSFKNGVDGLVQMAATSTQLGVNMGDALKLAQELLNPDKAQSFLNVINRFTGGQSIPGLQTNLQVVNAALNPEELNKKMTEFVGSLMEKDVRGNYDLPTQKKLLLGQGGFEQLQPYLEAGRTSRRMQDILSQIPTALQNTNSITDEVKNLLKTTAKSKEGEYFVPTPTGEKSLSAFTQSDIDVIAKNIITKGTDIQDRVLLSQNNITKTINELIGSLKTSGFEAARKVDINEIAKPIYDNLKLFTTSILKSAGAIESVTKIKGIPDIITSGIGENMSVVFKDITNKFKKLLTGEESLTSVINSFYTVATNIISNIPTKISKEYAQGKQSGINRGIYDKSSFLDENDILKVLVNRLSGGVSNFSIKDTKSEIDDAKNAIKAKVSNSAALLSPLTSTVTTPSATAATTTPTQPNDLKVSGDININIHPDRNFPNLINALDTVQIKNQIIKIIENHYSFSTKAAGQKPKIS
jgi:hypothetical protein